MNLSFRGPLSSLIRTLLAGAVVAAGTGLAACSGAVGSGNAPQRAEIATPGTVNQINTLRMYQCLTSGVSALIFFNDNSVGDFTGRVKWTSSNPGAVMVSNGDIPVGDGRGFYSAGTLVPAGPGNAIITADYFGIVSQLAVSVGTPQDITVKGILESNYVPLNRYNLNSTDASTGFSMGSGTSLQLAVTAVLDGVETDITKFATLGFQTANDNVATISSTTAMLNALNPGGPLVPIASFAPCNLTSITDQSKAIPFTVQHVQSINLQPEFLQPDATQPVSASNPLPALIVGNTEEFVVAGNLANGDVQDITAQSTLTLQPTGSTAAAFSSNILNALAPGGIFVSATFAGAGAGLTAPSVSITTRTVQLSAITICWTDQFTQIQACPTTQPTASVTAGSQTPVRFHAIGTFGGVQPGPGGTEVPITQEVTRQTTWTSSNPGVASISSSGLTAGQVLGVSQGSVTIQALNSTASNVPQKFAQVVVNPIQQTQ
ncbi:Ig-like domain-containing protein [Nevskia soli]|uniref:Ig-like domain-containing protein n=1 Tax=Nevskia soli TaxID=418856 RepID=UPI0004A7177D|nr:Ig-like domain-containing protein [Nevskia soli]